MSLDIIKEKGIAIHDQRFDWRDLVRTPVSKLDDDAFTRLRIILMNGVESEAIRFSHACARMNGTLRLPLAQVRRAEQHQQTLVFLIIALSLLGQSFLIGVRSPRELPRALRRRR